jgi:photosystem II stability/assembly factor-like uncharacterized protein
MPGCSRPQHRSDAQGTAKIVLSVAMFIAASVSGASVITKSYSFECESVTFAKDTVADTVFDIITMSNCVADDRLVGAPQLPQRAVSFLIPCSEKLDSIVATVTSAETLPGTYYPLPIQIPHDTMFYPPIQYFYDSGYPTDFVDGAVDGTMATYRMASFWLRPARLLPDGRLVRLVQLSVDIYTSASSGFGGIGQARRSAFCDEELMRAVGAIVENPAEAVTFGIAVPIDTPRSPLLIGEGPSLDGDPVDCVIVTQEAAAADYEGYARFLTERGIVTQVRTLEWIHANPQYHGADKAASVRAFLKDAYQHWGTLHAILAGWPSAPDIGLPTRMIRSHDPDGVSGWEGWATTDVYFADLEGTWNDDGDDEYAGPVPRFGMPAFCLIDGQHACGADRDYFASRSVTFITENGGTDWSLTNCPQDNVVLTDMSFLDDENGWCAGYTVPQGSVVWRTTDGGHNWYECEGAEFPGIRLSGVHALSSTDVVAIGCRAGGPGTGIILRSTDGGSNWASAEYWGLPFWDIEFSGQRGWLTTNSNVIMRTTDGGATWEADHTVPGTSSKTRYVSLADDDIGWATGLTNLGGAVWATSDGGVTWQYTTELPGVGVGIEAVLTAGEPPAYDVWAITPQSIHRGDLLGNWTEQYTRKDGTFCHVRFLDADHGWVVTQSDTSFLVTANGGSGWSEESPLFFRGDWSAQDMMPELFVARLPSKPQDGEARTVIDKLIAYQCAPETTHLNKVKMCAGMGPEGAADLSGLNALVDTCSWLRDLDIRKIWRESYGGEYPLTRENVLAGVNDGFQFLTHDYHGGDLYWQAIDDPKNTSERLFGSDFENPDVIYNHDMTGIAVTEGCNALFMLGDGAIGRQFLTCPTGGAVAYQGCSRPNLFVDVGPSLIYYSILRLVYADGQISLGPDFVAAVTSKCGAGRDRAYENLLGDPLMDIWSDVPGHLAVAHAQYVSPESMSFAVTVVDSETQLPVSGAEVCLFMCDSSGGAYKYPVYEIRKTDMYGTTVFPSVKPQALGEIVVNVTKHNYLPHRSTCHVGLLLNDEHATFPNWGRKLVREPNTDNYHVVFTESDTVFYSYSADGGATWSIPETVGPGMYPAVALNVQVGDGLVPWVVYLTRDGCIRRAIRVAPGTWDEAVVFDGDGVDVRAGAPSLAPGLTRWPTWHTLFTPAARRTATLCTSTPSRPLLCRCRFGWTRPGRRTATERRLL